MLQNQERNIMIFSHSHIFSLEVNKETSFGEPKFIYPCRSFLWKQWVS